MIFCISILAGLSVPWSVKSGVYSGSVSPLKHRCCSHAPTCRRAIETGHQSRPGIDHVVDSLNCVLELGTLILVGFFCIPPAPYE